MRFVITGWAAYIQVSYQVSHQALRGINLLTHFTSTCPATPIWRCSFSRPR
jgi:cbb3-type cytochrome oxidase subunit 1